MKTKMILSAMMVFFSVFTVSAATSKVQEEKIDSVKCIDSKFKDGISSMTILTYYSSGNVTQEKRSVKLAYSQSPTKRVTRQSFVQPNPGFKFLLPQFEKVLVTKYEHGYLVKANNQWEYHFYSETELAEKNAMEISPLRRELPSKKEEKNAPIRFREAVLVEPLRLGKVYPTTIRRR